MIVPVQHPATAPEQIPAELRTQLPQIEADLRQQLEQAIDNPREPAYFQALDPNLLTILVGSCDPTQADDPALDYDDAMELKLLQQQLP